MFEKWKDEFHEEMLEELQCLHKWIRNIPSPTMPKRYDPNEPQFDPGEITDGMESDDEDNL